MPSIRLTTTRKSSRTSSPFIRSADDSPAPPVEARKEKAQTSLDQWIEPPLKEPTPSFRDHGFERGGVLENMQPLGQPPSAKLKAKVKGDLYRRPDTSRNGLMSTLEEAGETSEATPSVEPRRSESQKPEEMLPEILPSRDDEADDDYMPRKKLKTALRPQKSAGMKNGTVTATPTQSRERSSSNAGIHIRTPVGHGLLQLIVDNAAVKAARSGDRRLGDALQNMYRESFQDEGLAILLNDILANKATTEQAATFKKYIRQQKKLLKVSRRMSRQYNNSLQSGANHSQSLEKPSTIAVPVSYNPAQPPTATHPTSSLKISFKQFPRSRRSSRSMSPNTRSAAKAEAVQTNGTASSSKAPARHRSHSVSSLSSLSDVDERIVEEGPPTSLDMSATAITSKALAAAAPSNAARPKLSLTLKQPKPSKPKPSTSKKRTPDQAGLDREPELTEEELNDVRQKLNESLVKDYKIPESHIRPPLVVQPESDRPSPSVHVPPVHLPAVSSREPNGIPRHLTRDELLRNGRGTLSSPRPEVFAPGAESASRPNTPLLLDRPAKKRKTARMKMSPVKKKTTVVAGVARAVGGMESPLGYDDNDSRSENNDFCSACGGSGFLLCCDGCDRSFHFTCCDPPLDRNASALDEPWFCFPCLAKGHVAPTPSRGLFSALLDQIDRRNPTAFGLPKDIQEYFEGVKAGDEGEYEEAHAQKSVKNRTGWSEVVDNSRALHDSKGSTILCTQCGRSALDRRSLVECDYCGDYWHLDCLDPPLANPPARGNKDNSRNMWMCPRHIDQDLRRLAPVGGGGRVHRVRRPRNAKIVDVALSRGFKNNGLIEIENESSDEEFIEENVGEDGVVHRIPERGIKLDFIHKVKQARSNRGLNMGVASGRVTKSSRASPARAQLRDNFAKRPFAEQKLALNLAQLAQKEADLGLDGDRVQALVYGLTANAPDDVAAAIAHAEHEAPSVSQFLAKAATPSLMVEGGPSDKERRQLEALAELIKRRLTGEKAQN
ncbi:hypothetical protein H2201_002084 [Coniosporium apollinis]|uniref:PHD-type domain-containing protein n=1 Tax=Coniosporium apollinis TaxID=61459 RepID=A0ABQ9P4V7_9PEZI|nr:hypothetical protein H2201_002084 [Coniosporium apollinis]